MIFGNPFYFSIIAEVIEEWNNEKAPFYNGVLLICVDGALFPKQVINATLSYDISELQNNLLNIAISNELFNMEKGTAFVEMYNRTFPSDINVDNDYQYLISTPALSDYHYLVFAVSNGKQTRVFASKLDYIKNESTHNLNNIDISESLIANDELKKIAFELELVLK